MLSRLRTKTATIVDLKTQELKGQISQKQDAREVPRRRDGRTRFRGPADPLFNFLYHRFLQVHFSCVARVLRGNYISAHVRYGLRTNLIQPKAQKAHLPDEKRRDKNYGFVFPQDLSELASPTRRSPHENYWPVDLGPQKWRFPAKLSGVFPLYLL